MAPITEGPSRRERAVVNYDDKQQSMQPGWLKSQKGATSSSPTENTKSRKSDSPPSSSEKENPKAKRAIAKPNKASKPQAPPKPKPAPKSAPKPARDDADKQPVAARGRNAGVTVVPIGERRWPLRGQQASLCAPRADRWHLIKR
jgi:hypothetical protein